LFSIGPARIAALIAVLAAAGGCRKKEDGGAGGQPAKADPAALAARDAAIQKWVDELQPSTLGREQQLAELRWFMVAAKPFAGMTIKVVSETIDTHAYESKTLAKAYEEITGLAVIHDLLQEGDVIEKLQTQMQSGTSIYDMASCAPLPGLSSTQCTSEPMGMFFNNSARPGLIGASTPETIGSPACACFGARM
jgi:ABC-type glycerol-3-phosphate transport system substrate-binding protein